jgi:hypothetical protein
MAGGTTFAHLYAGSLLPSEIPMSDTTATKVDSSHSPRGPEGQKYLASAVHIAMRLWEDEQPGSKPEEPVRRP